MMFKDALLNFLEEKTSEKTLKAHLNSFQRYIWKVGLVEDEIHLCIQIFLEFEHLSEDVRSSLLYCMVPKKKLPQESLKALLAWFFSNKVKDFKGSKMLLSWLSVMLSNNLIETGFLEEIFNEFLLCFQITELVPSLCSVLRHIVKPETVTARSVFIASSYYNQPVKYPEKKHIGCLLRLFYECSPSLVPNPPSGKASLSNSVSQFQQAVSALAFELGLLNTLPECILPKGIHHVSSSRQVNVNLKRKKAYQSDDFGEVVSDLPNLRMKSLGVILKQNKIPKMLNATSAIGCRAGQIYVCWKLVFEGDVKIEDFFDVPPLLPSVLETAQRMRSGWPELSSNLSRQLNFWESKEEDEILFKIISLASFDSYEEFTQKFLSRILNIFFVGSLKDKINVINCMTNLIANKITSVPKDVTIQLIKFVSRLIKILLASDGLLRVPVFFSSLKFYQHISYIEEHYKLGTWTIPPPFLVFGAFFSDNPILISDICELIVRHNVVMYPLYISLGIIEEFPQEEEIIKTYLRDLYLFLWKGKGSVTEFVSTEEEKMPWATARNVDSALTVRSHFGIQSLFLYIISHNELDVLKALNEKSLLKVLDKYAPGLSSVKKAYEGSIRDST